MKADERFATGVEHRSGDSDTADRIGPIEDDELLAMVGTGLHGLAHRRDVGVKASADVLYVEDNGVDFCEHGGRWLARLAIETEDFEAGCRVLCVADFGDIELACL